MIFVRPEREVVYNKLTTNNKLIKIFTDIGGLITTDDFYEVFGQKSKKNPKLYVSNYNEAIFEKLTDIFLDNEEYIKNHTIKELVGEKFLFSDIKIALGFEEDLSNSVYREIFYTYKNSYSDNFFQNNWKNFLPEAEVENLSKNEIAEALLDAFAIEFDKIDEILNNVNIFHSYDDIPEEYINYLTQLLGLEQKTFMIENDQIAEYRVLASNILEIYKQKGEFAAFELMFNLLGYQIEITQFYFDRRKYFASDEQNIETNESNKEDYKYYLTKTDPTLNKVENFEFNEIVTNKDLTERYELEEFNELVGKYGLECVLGLNDYYYPIESVNSKGEKTYNKEKEYRYDNKVYKYFKTNYFKIVPKPYGVLANFKTKQLYIINALLDFLTPYFWKRHVVINILGGSNGNPARDDESLTINGIREIDDNGENYQGFRILDSENWGYVDDTNDADPNRKGKEIDRIKLVKENYLLGKSSDDSDTIDEYLILKNNDIILSEKQYNYLLQKSLIDEDKFLKVYTISDQSLKEKTGKPCYVRKDKFLNDDGTINEKRIYYNSLGESKGDPSRLEMEKNVGRKINIVMEPTCRKIININSTKYWGKVKEENYDSSLPLYPNWLADYAPISDFPPGENYWFYPTASVNEKNHLYIPKHNEHDISKEWINTKNVDLVGLEGITLKKLFLDENEKTKIKWSENLTLKEFLEKIKNDSENAKLTKINNNCWCRVENLVVYKDKIQFVKAYNDIYEILLKYKNEFEQMGINIFNLNILEDISYINKLNILSSEEMTEYIRLCDIIESGEKHQVLDEYVKKHNVINYDYLHKSIVASDITKVYFNNENSLTIKSSKENDIIVPLLKNVYSYNSVFLQEITNENDKNFGNYYVYKQKLLNDGEHNRLYFVEAYDKNLIANYTVDSFENLNYFDNEQDAIKHNALCLINEKTYLYLKTKEGNTAKIKIKLGDVIYVSTEKKVFITECFSTNKFKFVENGKQIEITDNINNYSEIGDIIFTQNDSINKGKYSSELYQYKLNIKPGDLFYSKKEEKIYEFISNGFYFVDDNKFDNNIYTKNIVITASKDTEKNTETEFLNNINDMTEYFDDVSYEKTNQNSLIFGVKEYVLKGKLVEENGSYYIYSHDKYYKGVSEQDDNDNYILNNNYRHVQWRVLDGCDTNYLKPINGETIKAIARPTREKTDKVFEEALSSQGKFNNKQVVKNILQELLGNVNFLRERELVKRNK